MLYSNRYIFYDKVINQILHKKNVIWSKISPSKASRRLMGDAQVDRLELKALLLASLGPLDTIDCGQFTQSDRDVIMETARRAMNHEFNVLGSGWKKLDPIDWHSDFKTGKRWEPGKFYRDYRLTNPQGGFDIKTVWDLNRSHHMLWLAQAYKLTGDTCFANEIVAQITGWIDENPLMFSVNWTCSMDVAIRAVNWMYAIGIIIESGAVTDDFARKFHTVLFEHGFYIINNLEKTIPLSGNHYLSDLVGILFIFSLFPDSRFARRSYKFAKKEFFREALIEITPDGTNYEHSVSYHRLVSELFVWTYALLMRRKETVPGEVADRLFRMCRYIADYTKVSGFAPVVADNDNGRLLPFVDRDFRNHSYMIGMAANIFSKERFSVSQTPESRYASIGLTDIPQVITAAPKPGGLFKFNGMAILRKGIAELFVTNSDLSNYTNLAVGVKKGAHTHPDALSFELCLGGEDFFVDPGTYVYTSDPILRDELRATANHCTITVDNLNQTSFDKANTFLQTNNCSSRAIDMEGDCINGHFQYETDAVRYRHERTFHLQDNELSIKDTVYCTGEHEVCANFHLGPDIIETATAGGITLCGADNECSIVVESDSDRIHPEIIDSHYSPSYGVLEDSKNLVYRKKFKDSITIYVALKWKKK